MSLLKFDNCYSEDEGEVMERVVAMRDALLAANASIVYMLCEWVSEGWRHGSGGGSADAGMSESVRGA